MLAETPPPRPSLSPIFPLLLLSLLLPGCTPQPPDQSFHEVRRLGRAAENVLIDRESRHVLESKAVHEIGVSNAAGCVLELGYGSTGSGQYEVHAMALTEEGDIVNLLSDKAASGSWRDRRIELNRSDIKTLRLETKLAPAKQAGAAAPKPRWSRPLLYCPAAPGKAKPNNVLLICLDTLRADRLGSYGNALDLTPNIDKLAREGTLFEHGYAQFPNTLASHATMFTGYYPTQHGLLPGTIAGISADELTLARIFAEHGYRTVAYTEDAYVGSTFGFGAGFDQFHDGPETKAKEQFPGHAAETFARASKWLRERPDTPFFMFLHTYEVHAPYLPDRGRIKVVQQRAGFDYSGKFKFKFESLFELSYNRGRLKLTNEDLQQISYLYDAELMKLDEEVGRFRSLLERLGILDSTLVVIVSDHGEEFSEHGFLGHGETLHTQALHVPMIMRLPGSVAAGMRVGSRVGLIDLAPTLAELSGIDSRMKERPARSLLPLMTGADQGERRVFSQLNASRDSCKDWKVDDFKTCPYDGVALRDNTHTYIRAEVSGDEELYDTRIDPQELNDIAGEAPAHVIADYAQVVARFRESLAKGSLASVPIKVDLSTEDKLKALGYVE